MKNHEKMHNASTMVGMAFANAFLGIRSLISNTRLVHVQYSTLTYQCNSSTSRYPLQIGRDPQNTPCSLNMTTSVQTKDYADIARFMDGVIDKQSDAELVEFWHKSIRIRYCRWY